MRFQSIDLIHRGRPSVSYSYINIVLCASVLLGGTIQEVISKHQVSCQFASSCRLLIEMLMPGESSADTKLEGPRVKSSDSGQTKVVKDSEVLISTCIDRSPLTASLTLTAPQSHSLCESPIFRFRESAPHYHCVRHLHKDLHTNENQYSACKQIPFFYSNCTRLKLHPFQAVDSQSNLERGDGALKPRIQCEIAWSCKRGTLLLDRNGGDFETKQLSPIHNESVSYMDTERP